MELTSVNNSPQQMAAVLLDAWLSGDRCRLLWELNRMATLPRLTSEGAEGDRIEILEGIAGEMRSHTDLFASRNENARIGVWMDLLDHLSDRVNARPN